MRAAALLFILVIPGGDTSFEYRVAVSYHAKLVKNREWSIAVYRTGRKMRIAVDNFGSRSIVAPLEKGEYLALVDFLNRKGIWRLRDHYPPGSPNAFYKIEVESEGRRHSAVVEAGPLLSGYASRYREIIRRMENLAKIKLDG